MKQKDGEPIQRRSLHHWFTDVMTSLASKTEMGVRPFPGLEMSETEVKHPISAVSRELTSKIFTCFRKTWAAVMASKYVNMV